MGNTPVAVTASFATTTTSTPTASTTTLLLSSRADRSSPGPLAGATVAQNIFVFLSPVTASRVRFFVDDPGMWRAPFQTELYTPFDLAGGSVDTATPFDTKRIPDGPHTVTAAIDISTGGTAVASATFKVSNGMPSSPAPAPPSPAGYGLSVSTSPYRTNPKPLAGAVVSGPIYVFSSPDTGVTGARFYLDDPTMSGMPRQTEKSPPFDFAGGNVSVANAFDTGKISAGSHTITAALRLASGATAVVSATFSVQPKTLALSSTPNGSATLLLRSQADRSSPRALAGTTVARDIFVFLGSVSAQRVRFYVDDPGCRARPSRRNCALRSIWPGEPPRRPRPSTIADGAHTVTAAVDLSHGRHRGGERQRHGLQRPRHDQFPGPQDEIAASATRLFMRIAVKHGASRGFLLCQ